jgi:hypothetical protein
MKKFIDLKVVFLSSILFSVLHWFVYPMLPEAYKNQYILDDIVILVMIVIYCLLRKQNHEED